MLADGKVQHWLAVEMVFTSSKHGHCQPHRIQTTLYKSTTQCPLKLSADVSWQRKVAKMLHMLRVQGTSGFPAELSVSRANVCRGASDTQCRVAADATGNGQMWLCCSPNPPLHSWPLSPDSYVGLHNSLQLTGQVILLAPPQTSLRGPIFRV